METSMKLRPSPLCDASAAPASRSKQRGSGVGRGLRGMGMGLGVPGVGSATLRAVGGRCCARHWEMVRDAGEGDALPHLHSPCMRAKPWHCLCPCKPGVPPVLLPPWMSLTLCPQCSPDLLPLTCFPWVPAPPFSLSRCSCCQNDSRSTALSALSA